MMPSVNARASDFLASATEISSLPLSSLVNNRNFTMEGGESCATAGSIWYRFTPTETVRLAITADGPDATIGVYTGGLGLGVGGGLEPSWNVNDLVWEVCTDQDEFAPSGSEHCCGEFLIHEFQAGTQYSIQVGAASMADRDDYQVDFFSVTEAGQDDQVAAPLVDAFPFVDAVDNSGFSVESGEVACDGGVNSFWYRVQTSEPGTITVEAWAEDSEIGVFTGSANPLSEISSCAATDLDQRGAYSESYSFTGVPGETYLVRVSDDMPSSNHADHLVEIRFAETVAVPLGSFVVGVMALALGVSGLATLRRRGADSG